MGSSANVRYCGQKQQCKVQAANLEANNWTSGGPRVECEHSQAIQILIRTAGAMLDQYQLNTRHNKASKCMTPAIGIREKNPCN